jgi:sulfate adenylyltransferase subunit 1 (EFTu-like GTPase family)
MVEVASSGLQAIVRSIRVSGAEAIEATAGQAAAISLDREIDISRGDMLHAPSAPLLKSNRVEAVICWMHETPLEAGKRYVLLHTTRRVSAIVEQVLHRVDVDTLDPSSSAELGLNDLGRVVIRTANPLSFDQYADIPGTGSFVLVDPSNNATVAGGMLQGISNEPQQFDSTPEGFDAEAVELAERIRRFAALDSLQARALLESILMDLP